MCGTFCRFEDAHSLLLLLIPFLWWMRCWWAEAHGLDLNPIKTYSEREVLHPAAWWAWVDSKDICLLAYILSSSCQLYYYLPTITHPLTAAVSWLESLPPPISSQQPAGVSRWHLSVGDGRCQPLHLQQGLTCYLFHFSSCITLLPQQLISYEEPAAVRRRGCTNQQPLTFSWLSPRSKICPFNLLVCSLPVPLPVSVKMGH